MKRPVFVLVWLCASTGFVLGADTVITNQLGQGVVFRHYHYDSLDGGKQEIYITEINLNDPTVSVRFPHLTAGRTVSAHAGTVTNATVAVNGQFFDSSGSVQFLKVSNSIIYQSRAAVHDEQAVTDDGLGHTNSIAIALRSGGINSWTNSTKASIMACGVELVKNGAKILDSGYDPNDTYVTTLNPRTCVAWTYDNHLLLMCVDGRTANAHGMTIYQLRDDVFTRGSIRHAFGLDGGGSTDMWARGLGVCNVPSDGVERAVADAVVIVAPPAPPVNLAATVAITNGSLSWSASTGATSYNLKRSTTNGGPYTTIVSRTTTSYTNTGLAPGTTFYFVVTAVNGAGESSGSAPVAATTAPTPAAPGNLTAAPGDKRVVLGWDAVPGILSYHLKRAFTNGGPYSVISNLVSTAYTNIGMANGTTAYYVVSALNSAGEGANSSQASATPQCPAQAPPASLTATLINGQIALNWSAVAGAAVYTVYRANAPAGSFVAQAGLSGTNYNDATFGAGASLYFVRAANPCGSSADSSVASAPLVVTGWAVSGTQAVMAGWGGVAGQSFYVLGSTNGAASVSQWTRLGTNVFGAGGSFNVTNALDPASPQQFYLIQAAGP